MNYTESKIKNIQGYSKGSGYSVFKPPVSNHEWNAVEINGKWCLIDTTWDTGTGYYLCTPPRCFVTDHLPDEHFNNSLQEKNISYNNLNEQYLKLIQEFNEYKEKTEKNMNDSRIKIDELNKELNDAYELNDEYKNKINAYKNKIKELNEDKKNYDNDLDINYKGNSFKRRSQKNNPNKENDIKSNILSNENDKKINNNSDLEEKLFFSEKQKDYILSLLLKVTPNKKLIQEIIDLNLEILQMEKQKENIVKKMKENPYLKNILPKIDEQINNFREQLLSLEDELISVDFGSSRIYENSIQN